jgi:hypothetical protein
MKEYADILEKEERRRKEDLALKNAYQVCMHKKETLFCFIISALRQFAHHPGKI